MIKIEWNQQTIANLVNNFEKVNVYTKTGAKKGLTKFAQQVMAESKAEVPIDTTTLQSTAYILPPVEMGDNVSIEMGYGGPNDKMNPDSKKMASEYMVDVHELDNFKHPYGKRKFLEDPVNRNKETLLNELAIDVAVSINSGNYKI